VRSDAQRPRSGDNAATFIRTTAEARVDAVTASIGRLRGLEWRGMVNVREEDK